MKQKIILITWWLWYIWTHWVVAFEEAWYKTVILDNLSNSCLSTYRMIWKILGYKPDFYECDLRDKTEVEKIFEKYDFDWVLHFAWLKTVWESCEKPILYYDNNLTGSIKLFECMEKHWVKNIIFSSSATVYDWINFEKTDFSWSVETDLLWNTTNPYGRIKFLLENILTDLSDFAWFNVINLRYFNPIWAHKSWYIWENPEGLPNNLLPFILKVATWELEKVKVFGWDYNTIDWTWVRDYIDVVDLIDWHLKAYKLLEKQEKNWFIDNINLWVWKWNSVLEMIKTSEKITWRKINYEIVWRRQWDLADVYCNPKKAKEVLWWEAKTSLEDSLKNSWNFFNN